MVVNDCLYDELELNRVGMRENEQQDLEGGD